MSRLLVYILEVAKERIKDTSDMLRYDNAFEIEETESSYKVHTTRFTPDRWQSFGYIPKVLLSYRILSKEYDNKVAKAIGFTEGFRFAQKLLGGYLMQAK